MIKAVFFDIGNVLLFFDKAKVAAKVRAALGDPKLDVAACFWTSAHSCTAPSEYGKLSPRQTYEAFRKHSGYAGDFPAFKKLWSEQFTLNRPAAAALAKLAKAMPVYLLSNTNALHYEHFEKRYAFPGQVKGAVLSYQVGACKPEPAIYAAAVKMAGVKASECFFMDDLPANVEAARAFGMKAEVYSPMRAKSLLASLSSMSVQRPQAVS
jgi:HAD superfamily hydrolase (TIGR01509 family)